MNQLIDKDILTKCLIDMGVNTNDVLQMIDAYRFLQEYWLNCQTGLTHTKDDYPAFQKQLAEYSIYDFSKGKDLNDFITNCKIACQHLWGKNVVNISRFIRLYIPAFAYNLGLLSRYLGYDASEELSSEECMLLMLCMRLANNLTIDQLTLNDEDLQKLSNILKRRSISDTEISPDKQFLKMFSCTFFCPLPSFENNISPVCGSIINNYKSVYGDSYKQSLLEDCTAWETCWEILSKQTVRNPYAYYYKGILKKYCIHSNSVEASLFNSWINWHDYSGDIAAAVDAFGSSVDYSIENFCMKSVFDGLLQQSERIIVKGVSFEFIHSYSYASEYIGPLPMSFVVETDLQASILHHSINSFCQKYIVNGQKNVNIPTNTEVALIVKRVDSNFDVIDSAVVSGCISGSSILLLLPCSYFESPIESSAFQNFMSAHNCFLQELMIVDVQDCPTKNRAICILKKDVVSNSQKIIVRRIVASTEREVWFLIPKHKELPQAFLWETCKSEGLLSIWHGMQRKRSLTYQFSPEIALNISQSSEKGADGKNSYIYRCHYNAKTDVWKALIPPRNSKSPQQLRIPRKKTRFKEENPEAVAAWAEEIALEKDMSEIIRADLHKYYSGKDGPRSMSTTALKTMWFCLRPILLKNKRYQDEIACELFCSPRSSEFSVIHPQTHTLEQYQSAMEKLFSDTPRQWFEIGLKYWRQLKLILSECIDQKWVTGPNPIEEITMLVPAAHASTEEQRMRNALGIHSLSHTEECAIIAFLVEQVTYAQPVMRYVVDSLSLASAIRLYTGMATREVCGLHWGDFREIQSSGYYQLLISRFVDEEGLLLKDMDIQVLLKKCRKIPLAPQLSQMLDWRKQFLLNVLKIPTDILDSRPIISSEPLSAVSRNWTYCKPRNVRKACIEVLKAAHVQESAMTPNNYLFPSNFDFHARHDCNLSVGKVCYILGINAPDTYSQSYCDYARDDLQIAMACQLHRWDTLHNSVSRKPITDDCWIQWDYEEKDLSGWPSPIQVIADIDVPPAGTMQISTKANTGVAGHLIVSEGEDKYVQQI